LRAIEENKLKEIRQTAEGVEHYWDVVATRPQMALPHMLARFSSQNDLKKICSNIIHQNFYINV
jgi:hypothetical protein